MRSMRRWNIVLLLVLAIAVASQPILHNHPLIPGSGPERPSISSSQTLPCAVCAVSKGRAIVERPVLGEVFRTTEEIAPSPELTFLSVVVPVPASRAPPIA